MQEGKLGLALSGGGFRASFFHIGVLARLADCDLLRHVEVISTVSGGSIIGALYYLKLKMLLETKKDAEITADDYRRLVGELIEQFRSVVQKNPRLLTFADPWKNLKMSRADYSRSDRAGELFDELLYRPVFGPDRKETVRMRELLIRPKGETDRFHPERHNVHRRAKVPILLINATSLNTGRHWRFEAIRMGEPPPVGKMQKDLDRRLRLIRPERYHRMPSKPKNIGLGHAVAASAAVPGLFHPLSVSCLYENVRVQLVDGGVNDNQGVQGLLDRGCSQLIVSDGSSQMEGEKHPSTFLLRVVSRSHGIMMSRIREEQILGADCREGIEALCFIHLRQGLCAEEIPYIDRHEKTWAAQGVRPGAETTRYGIAKQVQEALSRIRTDLDAFHDAESFSLMESGYVLAQATLPEKAAIWRRKGPVRLTHWPFRQIGPMMTDPEEQYLKALRTGAATLFKVSAFYPVWAVACALGLSGLMGFLIWYYWDFLKQPIALPPWVPSRIVVTFGGAWLGLSVYPPFREFFANLPVVRTVAHVAGRWMGWIVRFLFRGLPSAVASLFVLLYLKWMNPLYLRAGEIHRFVSVETVQEKSREAPRRPPFLAN